MTTRSASANKADRKIFDGAATSTPFRPMKEKHPPVFRESRANIWTSTNEILDKIHLKTFQFRRRQIQICRQKKKERRAILRPTKCCRFFDKMQKRRAQLCCRQGRQFQIDISVMPSNLTCTLTPIQSGDESAAPNIRRVNKFQRLIAWPITTTASPLFQYFKNFISTQSFPLINDFNSIFFAI